MAFRTGDMITTAAMNHFRPITVDAPTITVNGRRVLTEADITPAAPSLVTLASVAAIASASSTPLSRRRFLRWWR